jgi:hypothetical protein
MSILTSEDRQAFAEGRLAKLRVALRLTPAQEKHWPAFEATCRDLMTVRSARLDEVRSKRSRSNSYQPVDIAARLQERAQGLKLAADRAERFATAARPLLDAIDEAQKRRFGLLLRKASLSRARLRRGAGLVQCIRRQMATA